MKVIGLTGGIGCGKSVVSKVLKGKGYAIIDCDVVAREVVKKDHWGYKRVVKAFGPNVLLPNGEIDRERLGKLVFSDAVLRRRLNFATHLPIAMAVATEIAWHWLTWKPVVVVDMPLLFETGASKLVSHVIVVHTDEEYQVSRIMKRDGLPAADAKARVVAQMPGAKKAELADVVLLNDGTLEELQAKAADLAKRLTPAGDLGRQSLAEAVLTSPLFPVACAAAAVASLVAKALPMLTA